MPRPLLVVRLPAVLALLLALGGSGAVSHPPVSDETATKPLRFTLLERSPLVSFSADGRRMAAASWNPASKKYRVRIYDVAGGRPLGEADDPDPERFCSVTLAPSGTRVALLHLSHLVRGPVFTVTLWDVTADGRVGNPKSLEPEAPFAGWEPFRVAFSPDARLIAAGTPGEVVYLWDATSGELKRRFQGGYTVDFSPDCRTLVAATRDGEVRRFDTAIWKFLGPERPSERGDFLYVAQTLLAPDGKRIALSDQRTTLIKDVETNRTLCRLSLPVETQLLSISADGGTLALATEDSIRFFDTTTGDERGWLKRAGEEVFFLGDGKYLAVCDDRSVTLREVRAVLGRTQQPRFSERPAGETLEAELVAVSDTYPLELEGNTPEEFSARIRFGWDWPDSPRVELGLRLHNTGKENITLRGDDQPSVLYLVGPGALNRWPRVITQTGVGLPPPGQGPPPVILAPGESHTFPIKDLSGSDNSPYWVVPGKYLVAGDYGRSHLAPVKVKVVPAKATAAVDPPALPFEVPVPPAPGAVIVPEEKDPRAEEVEDKLYFPVTCDGFAAPASLTDAVEYITDRYNLRVRIDEEAFQKAGQRQIGDREVTCPRLRAVNLSVLFEVLLAQVGGRLNQQGHEVRILPDDRNRCLAERLKAGDRRSQDRLNEPMTLPDGIEAGTPLCDALQKLSEQSELSFAFDVTLLKRAGMNNVETAPVGLRPRADVPLREILEDLLGQANARFVLRDWGLVVVVPGHRKSAFRPEP